MPNVPVPKTWVDNEFATAPVLNTEIRDIFNFVLAPPRVVLARTATLSVPSGTNTAIPWDNEILDTFGGWVSTAATRYTVQVPGKYRVSAVVSFSNHSDNIRVIRVRVNGATPLWTIASASPVHSVSADTIVTTSLVLPYTFAIGEYFEIMASQSTGSTLFVSGSSGNDSYMTAEWVGS